MRQTALTLFAGLAMSLASAVPATAECAGATAACSVPMGDYHIRLPGGDGPHPAILFIHGFGGSGEGALRTVSAAVARGYAVIGPQGLRREAGGRQTSWSFHPERPEQRDESVFFRQVIDDAVERHGVDPSRILIAGFSIGGSMTSYLACEDPGIARAYAPVAGAFWRPHPEMTACAGPVDLFHTHGWQDGTVPLEGRVLGGGAIRQGDVFYALQVWRETNGCDRLWPDDISAEGEMWRRRWTSCEAGSLEFALHPGGHGVPRGWTEMVLDWFEGL